MSFAALNAPAAVAASADTSGITPQIKATSQQFEQVFLSKVLGEMFAGVQGDGPMGTAGPGGEIWRSMMTDQFAKEIAAKGGIGLSNEVAHELVRLQESKG